MVQLPPWAKVGWPVSIGTLSTSAARLRRVNSLKGLKKTLLSSNPDSLVLTAGPDGQQTWVTAGAIRDPKSAVTKDENLSWEEFNQAAPRMIIAMKQHEWPEDRISMHVQFWTALQTHCWRHDLDELRQRTLLLYQSQQHHLWHLTVGGPNSWSIAELNNDLIVEAREELFNAQCSKALAALQQVRTSSLNSSWYPAV